MLIKELLETTALTEVKMSYSSLKSQAGKIEGARVGMEFEMYVPGVNAGDREPEWEPDWEMDGYINTGTWKKFSDDVIDFFTGGDFSNYSRRELERLIEREIQPEFDEWLEGAWREHAEDELEEWYLKHNPDEEDLPPKGTRSYERILDEYREEVFDDWLSDGDKINAWLEAERIDKYRKLADRYNLDWPHMIDVNEGEGHLELSDIADDFEDATGITTRYSDSYHGRSKDTATYMIEPDSSLDSPDSGGDSGLEFVSPPLGIEEMIDQLEKVRKWAGRMGAYTNSSTGLHINVSLPGYSIDKIDYVKLALFLGDQWVLEQFDRLGNMFAKSALSQIEASVAKSGSFEGLLKAMKNGMSEIASKIIHSGHTDKYVSINTKDNRIEFRSPGGDWLDENYDKIVVTMLRFVVAMDIALDPTKERKEYAKKFYRLLTLSMPESEDTLRYFAQYSAGMLPKAALKSFVRHIQQRRQDLKKPPAQPSQPASQPTGAGEQEYSILNRFGNVLHSFTAVSPRGAERYADSWARENAISGHRVQLAEPSRPGQEVGTYRITYRRQGSNVDRTTTIDANSRRDAVEEFTSTMPSSQYEIIRLEKV
jgi:hypothetical protein